MHRNAVTLTKSVLDTILYADIGTELNGSALTTLSMIARLGGVSRKEAARWAMLPRPAVIDGLSRSIAQMPLAPPALAETRITAAPLALLLPAPAQGIRQNGAEPCKHSVVSRPMVVTILYCALTTGMALSMLALPDPATPAAMQTQQMAGEKVSGTRTQAADRGNADASLTAAKASAERQARRVLGKAGASFPGAPSDLR